MLKKIYYPFSAVVGQNDIREALILNLINPKIGGVLINGEKGTAKSTLVRALIPIIDCPFTEVPVSVSEDCLCGSIDLEKTMTEGSIHVDEGLLSKADGGILYIDEINLLPDSITDLLIQALSSGTNRIEREGISLERESSFVIIGTMNSAGGDMRSQLTDYFGLYAQAQASENIDERIEIVKRIEAFEADPYGFLEKYQSEENALKQSIEAARRLMDQIEVSEENLSYIVNACIEAAVEGHRADIVMVQTAKAVAAFHGKTYIDSADIDEAAYFVFPHRRRSHDSQSRKEEQENEEEAQNNEQQDAGDNEKSSSENEEKNREPAETPSDGSGNGEKQKSRYQSKSQTSGVGESFKVVPFSHIKDRKSRIGTGKRTLTKTAGKSGRYVYATMDRRNNDLALDATIRAAAPYQRFREKEGVAIAIKAEDIREKVRQKRVANLLVFVVDASGSMGAQKRMAETKGAILSLLKDAYVKRDKISLVTFSGNEARVILPPTGSVERGVELLREIETGGKTPLNAGIGKGLQVIQSEMRKRPDVMPMLIVITDGRGNVSLDGEKKPVDEMLEMSEKIQGIKQIDSMVIDIEKSGIMSFGIAKRLADALGGKYFKLDELRSDDIINIVRASGKSEAS